MTHGEFIEAYKVDKMSTYVNPNKAISSLKSHFAPKTTKMIYSIWMLIFLFSIPLAVVSFIWIKWYVGSTTLTFGLVLWTLMRKSACKTVQKIALDNKSFYEYAIESRVLVLAQDIGEPDSEKFKDISA